MRAYIHSRRTGGKSFCFELAFPSLICLFIYHLLYLLTYVLTYVLSYVLTYLLTYYHCGSSKHDAQFITLKKGVVFAGSYYCLNMIIITLSCFLNVLIVDLTAHGTRANKPPGCIWVRSSSARYTVLGQVVCLHSPVI